jgi:hypothetical protein
MLVARIYWQFLGGAGEVKVVKLVSIHATCIVIPFVGGFAGHKLEKVRQSSFHTRFEHSLLVRGRRCRRLDMVGIFQTDCISKIPCASAPRENTSRTCATHALLNSYNRCCARGLERVLALLLSSDDGRGAKEVMEGVDAPDDTVRSRRTRRRRRRSSWLRGVIVDVDDYRAISVKYGTSNNFETIVDTDSDSRSLGLLISGGRTGNIPTACGMRVGVRDHACGLHFKG